MPKKSAARKLARKAAAIVRETKQTARNVKASVKAVKKAVRSVAKVARKSKPVRNDSGTYELREAPFTRGATVMQRLSSLERNASKFDKLKEPNEKWVASIFGGQTQRAYDSIEKLVKHLNERYPVFDKQGKEVEDPHNDISLMNNVQILSLPETAKEHYYRRKAEREQHMEELKKDTTVFRKQFGSRDANGKLRYARDFLKLSMEENKKLKESQATLEKRLADLEKLVSKGERTAKKTAKKASKVQLSPQQKAAATRKANREAAAAEAARKAALRSEAAKRAAATRAKNKAAAQKLAAKRSKAAKKAAKTRKANRRGKR